MRLYPGQKVGPLRVERHLGGDASVEGHAVVRPDTGTDHALFVVRSDVTFDADRVPTEVSHPSLVRVDRILSLDGTPALLTELVTGPTLERVLRDGSLTLEQVDALAADLLGALAALHGAERVHGDLRPETIRLDLQQDAPRARLTVLGLPPSADDEVKLDVLRYRARHGSPPQRDVFAVGCVLYELLMGRPAYTGKDRAELLRALDQASPPPLPAHLPEHMRRTVDAAVGPVAGRPRDARDLAELWDAPDAPRVVSWADRRLEGDDEAISLSAPVPLVRQAAPRVEILWARPGDVPDPDPGATSPTAELDAAPDLEPVHAVEVEVEDEDQDEVIDPDPPPAPPDPSLASLDTLPPDADPGDGQAPPDGGALEEVEAPRPATSTPGPARSRARDPVHEGLKVSLLAGSIGIGVALGVGITSVCLFGGGTWLLGDSAPARTLRDPPPPSPVTWPPPPIVDQTQVPADHVRLQLVAHSPGVAISWQAPATGATSDAPMRSGELGIVPVGELAVAWASATSRASCVVTITPDTRQLRLDGRAQRCEAR